MSKHYELSLVIQLPLQIKIQDTEALLGSANQKRERGSAGSSEKRLGGVGWARLGYSEMYGE